MTREEREKAIYALKISAPLMAVTQGEFNDYIQTLNKIMDWIEQEPCEDSIVEWKKDFKGYVNSLSMPRDDYKGIMEYIDELPVKPQPKMGHWEYNPLDICFQCSQCKCCCEDDYKQPPKYKYCPQCGAKMQEVKE